MKLDGNAVYYQLTQEFDDVVCEAPLRSIAVDYPMLYDVSLDMSGHVVLVPDHERPGGGPSMRQVLCVCTSGESAEAAKRAGLSVVRVRDNVTFPHLYNRMQSVYVRNERLDARLRTLVDTHAGYEPLLEACARAFGFHCTFIDEQYRIVASSAEDADWLTGLRDVGVLEDGAVDLFMASRNYRHMREGRKVTVVPSLEDAFMRNVFHGSRLVGSLIMRHHGDSASARYVRFLLNYLAPFVEEMYARVGTLRVSASRSARLHSSLKSAFAGDTQAAHELARQLVEYGARPDARYVLLRIVRSFTNEGADDLEYAARRFERLLPRAYCANLAGELFALVEIADGPLPAVHAAPDDLPIILRENLVKAGVSRPFSDMGRLTAARIQASAAFEQGSSADPSYWCYWFEDYALTWLLKHGLRSVPAEFVCHPAIEQLSAHDRTNGSELLHTLSVFVECRYNATAAAGALFVARSTLLNRIARITEVTSLDLDDFEERVYLETSLALMRP